GDLNIEQIPFEGQAELITNLLGENLDAIVVNTTPDVLDGIENGEYNAIATFATDRIDYLPDTPTLAEEGYDMATNATSQFGLFAPAEIDDTAFDDLEAGLEEALQTDDVRQSLGEDYMSEEFIDHPSWTEQMKQTRSTYEEFFGE